MAHEQVSCCCIDATLCLDICYSPYGHKLISGTETAHMGNFLVSMPIPARGLPVWLWGFVFLPYPESRVRRRATYNFGQETKISRPAFAGNGDS
jgi:hypothetical protein